MIDKAAIQFVVLRLKRLLLTAPLKPCVAWKPRQEFADGYSVVLACVRSLAPLAVANLRLCAKTQSPKLVEVIVIFDCPPDDIPQSVLEAVRELSPRLKIRLVGYSDHQHRMARFFQDGWIYAWMSWCLGIAEAKTRAVIIHDLDAFPIAADFFERLYENWLESKAQFCGIHTYHGHGVTREMGLARTPEMTLDSSHVRERFHPFDLYNNIGRIDGRVVKFDTTLHAQWRSPLKAVRPIDESHFIHPSQLICDYTQLISGRSNLSGKSHSLPILPYFMYVGGDGGWLDEVGGHLSRLQEREVRLGGRRCCIDGIPRDHWTWMETMIRRLEHRITGGGARAEVEDYLTGFRHRAGGERTGGAESGEKPVIEKSHRTAFPR